MANAVPSKAKPRASQCPKDPLRVTLIVLLAMTAIIGIQIVWPFAVFSRPGQEPLTAEMRAAGAVFSHLPADEQAFVTRKTLVSYPSIMMEPIEVDLLLRYMSNVSTYLEWGSGGSTQNFPQFATARVVSIEHNLPWCERGTKSFEANSNPHKVDLRCVEVKEGYRGWRKEDEGSYPAFQAYIDEIDNLDQKSWDLVLVDGRARVDCAIKLLSYLHKDSVMVLHDADRLPGRYSEISSYYMPLRSVTGHKIPGIVAMRRLAEFDNLEGDHAAVQAILNDKYKTEFDALSQDPQ